MLASGKTWFVGSVLAIVGAMGCEPSREAEASGAVVSAQVESRIDWAAVDAAMGREGSPQEGGMRRYGMPRTDVVVESRGVRILPGFALGSWIGMLAAGANEVVAMGDLVLMEEEVAPVLEALLRGGLAPSAVHKHLPEHSPALWWAHVMARGEPVDIARSVRAALEVTGTPAGAPTEVPFETGLDTTLIAQELGHAGRYERGVYSVSVPRAEKIEAMGVTVPPTMGTATAMNFQATGPGRAAATGDFVMTAAEVEHVAAKLLEHDIEIVSLHNHLVDEQPRLFFMHFWAEGDVATIARGLRAAMDEASEAAAADRTWDFEDVGDGPPTGWRIEQSNPRSDGAEWAVVEDAGAASGRAVLSLVDPRGASGNTCNVAWTDEIDFADGRIEVKVRASDGREDRGGGPVWRVQDANNYYVARWNPLEDNVRLYYVRGGSRQQLASADVEASDDAWHVLAIEHRGDRITGYFDGERVWEERDETFASPGGVGVWTKADAASSFDDLQVSEATP